MDSRNNTRAKMIVWLRDTIEQEIGKPDDEIDYELVDELSKLLSELMGDQGCLTEEEAKQRLAQIVGHKPKEVKRKPRVKLKRIVAIACAALVLISGTMAIGAFDGSFKSMLKLSYTLDVGKTFDENGITYINMNNTTTYTSIEELVESEKLDIKFPTVLPEGVKINNILYNNANSIFIKFNDETLHMEICNIADIPMDSIIKNSSKFQINEVNAFIMQINKQYSSYTIIDNHVYVIESDSEEKIKTILIGLLGD